MKCPVSKFFRLLIRISQPKAECQSREDLRLTRVLRQHSACCVPPRVTDPCKAAPQLTSLLPNKQIACIDSMHPASLLRDLNSPGPFCSAVDDAGQTHHTP